jgi:lipopolysaccharide export system permease protein
MVLALDHDRDQSDSRTLVQTFVAVTAGQNARMRINTIINRYTVRELLPPFGINMFFFTFIFLITKILEVTNMVVNFKVSLLAFLLLLLYSMPFFLAFITPMSVMMAVLLTFLRMSGDNELVALRACGMNPKRFLIPICLFCFLGWLLTTFISMVGLPWGNRSYYGLTMDLAQSHVDAVIKERTFIDSFKGLTLYVNKINLHDRTLSDVFIEDQRNKGIDNIIVAPKGRIFSEPNKQVIRLRLSNGTINQVDLAGKTVHSIAFATYAMNLDLKEMLARGIEQRKPIEEMGVYELWRYIKEVQYGSRNYYKALMKFHEKFALPFACFTLGLVALPLGMQAKRGRRSMGTVLGIILFLVYYILLSVGWSFGESGALPPALGMWIPNLVMGGFGFYLLARMGKQ